LQTNRLADENRCARISQSGGTLHRTPHLLAGHQDGDLVLLQALLVARNLATQVLQHAVHEALELALVAEPILFRIVQRVPLQTRVAI